MGLFDIFSSAGQNCLLKQGNCNGMYAASLESALQIGKGSEIIHTKVEFDAFLQQKVYERHIISTKIIQNMRGQSDDINVQDSIGDVITVVEMNPKLTVMRNTGHKPRYEFEKHQGSAIKRGISRKEFLDEHNNPDDYRPELPSSNRSHKGENHKNTYFGL